ncbi:MAG TPA: hypothetical protein VNL17_04795 [Verrucomicrobiae bacterium]|nr:hypothetical protein [Verrucomicrobiae bacterium]
MTIRHTPGRLLFPATSVRRSWRPTLFLAVCAALALLAFAPASRANGVTATTASGGSNISADTAQDATSPAFTTLGNIVIAENATADFAIGTNVTLILTAPSGWRFKAGTGSIKFARNRDMTSARISVSASNITVTLTVAGTSESNSVTISGIKVQAADGAVLPSAGNILRTSANPGTAVIAGIVNDATNFGSLSQVAGAAKALLVQTQPSSIAMAGVAFAQQPVIEVVDQFGNRRGADNSTAVTAAPGTGMLQGTTTIVASGGLVTFTDLSCLKAGTTTLNFTGTGLISAASDNVMISSSASTKLQLLVPGEKAAPGTSTGKTGPPAAQTANTPFTITMNVVDASWNVVNTVTDFVHITSTDTNAMLPPDVALVAGTNNSSFTFGMGGTYTITASDASDAGISSNTSPSITVNTSPITAATGGTAISADTVGGASTALTGPVYTEKTRGNIGTGTIILNAPAGFVFDTSCCPLPTIKINGDPSSLVKNINNNVNGGVIPLTMTSTQLTFTVSSRSTVPNTLTWQNLRVRPTAGAPLADGMITKSGTSAMVGVTDKVTTFGLLREVE